MYVTFTPANGEKREWVFDPDEVYEDEAEALEKVAECPWDAWVRELRRGASRVRRSLLWYLLRKDHPELKFIDLQRFRKGELLVEFSVRELQKLREDFEKSRSMSESAREDLLAECDGEIERAAAKFGDPGGKALSPSSEPITDSPSLNSSEFDPGKSGD